MIRKVYMKNMKGSSKIQELTGRDIFIGPNGIGKTTILQAIGLSLLGWVPGNGKKNEETFKLANGNEMACGLELDGFKFMRKFTRTEKENKKTGEVKVEISQEIELAPSKGERTTTQKEARIYDEVGNFPVMIDFNEFLSLSDAKRREFFYNLSPIKTDMWTRDKIRKYLVETLLTDELKENNPDKYFAVQEAIEETLTAYPPDFDIQSGLTAMADYVAGKLSYWKKEKSNAAGAVKKLADIKNELEENDRGITTNKAKLEEYQAKLQELSAQIARDTEKKKAIEKHKSDIEALKAEIKEWEDKTCPDDIKALEAEIAEAEAQKRPVVDYAKKRADIESAIKEIKKEIEDLTIDYNTTQQLIFTTQNAFDNFNNAVKQIEDIEATRKELQQKAAASGKKADYKVYPSRCVINPMISCDKDFSKFLDYAKRKMAESSVEIARYKAELADIANQLNMKKAELSEKEKTFRKTYEDEKADNAYNNELDKLIENRKIRIQNAKNFDQLKAETIAKKKAALEKLESMPLEAIGDITLMEEQKKGIELQIKELKEKIAAQEQAKITLQNLQASIVDDRKATNMADAFKLIQEAIGFKGIQGMIVKSILDPIRDAIQAKQAELGITDQFYFLTESDTGKEIFQFGWYNEEKGYRNFDALSQGEKLMLLIALIVTIIELNNPKLKVLMIDNIENLDSRNFENVVGALGKIAKSIDNIILAGVIDIEYAEGFKVWRLGE